MATNIRRPIQFWKSFNNWWRHELERLGRRPLAGEITRWYEDNAEHTWPPEVRPTMQETRVHAKCMRSVDAVRVYFRNYRAKRHRGDNVGSDDPDGDEETYHDDDQDMDMAEHAMMHEESHHMPAPPAMAPQPPPPAPTRALPKRNSRQPSIREVKAVPQKLQHAKRPPGRRSGSGRRDCGPQANQCQQLPPQPPPRAARTDSGYEDQGAYTWVGPMGPAIAPPIPILSWNPPPMHCGPGSRPSATPSACATALASSQEEHRALSSPSAEHTATAHIRLIKREMQCTTSEPLADGQVASMQPRRSEAGNLTTHASAPMPVPTLSAQQASTPSLSSCTEPMPARLPTQLPNRPERRSTESSPPNSRLNPLARHCSTSHSQNHTGADVQPPLSRSLPSPLMGKGPGAAQGSDAHVKGVRPQPSPGRATPSLAQFEWPKSISCPDELLGEADLAGLDGLPAPGARLQQGRAGAAPQPQHSRPQAQEPNRNPFATSQSAGRLPSSMHLQPSHVAAPLNATQSDGPRLATHSSAPHMSQAPDLRTNFMGLAASRDAGGPPQWLLPRTQSAMPAQSYVMADIEGLTCDAPLAHLRLFPLQQLHNKQVHSMRTIMPHGLPAPGTTLGTAEPAGSLHPTNMLLPGGRGPQQQEQRQPEPPQPTWCQLPPDRLADHQTWAIPAHLPSGLGHHNTHPGHQVMGAFGTGNAALLKGDCMLSVTGPGMWDSSVGSDQSGYGPPPQQHQHSLLGTGSDSWAAALGVQPAQPPGMPLGSVHAPPASKARQQLENPWFMPGATMPAAWSTLCSPRGSAAVPPLPNICDSPFSQFLRFEFEDTLHGGGCSLGTPLAWSVGACEGLTADLAAQQHLRNMPQAGEGCAAACHMPGGAFNLTPPNTHLYLPGEPAEGDAAGGAEPRVAGILPDFNARLATTNP